MSLIYLCCFNAYLFKTFRPKGLFYKSGIWMKEKIRFFKYHTVIYEILSCLPCRMFWMIGFPQSVILSAYNGFAGYLTTLLLPFGIAGISYIIYRLIAGYE